MSMALNVSAVVNADGFTVDANGMVYGCRENWIEPTGIIAHNMQQASNELYLNGDRCYYYMNYFEVLDWVIEDGALDEIKKREVTYYTSYERGYLRVWKYHKNRRNYFDMFVMDDLVDEWKFVQSVAIPRFNDQSARYFKNIKAVEAILAYDKMLRTENEEFVFYDQIPLLDNIRGINLSAIIDGQSFIYKDKKIYGLMPDDSLCHTGITITGDLGLRNCYLRNVFENPFRYSNLGIKPMTYVEILQYLKKNSKVVMFDHFSNTNRYIVPIKAVVSKMEVKSQEFKKEIQRYIQKIIPEIDMVLKRLDNGAEIPLYLPRNGETCIMKETDEWELFTILKNMDAGILYQHHGMNYTRPEDMLEEFNAKYDYERIDTCRAS